MEDYEQKYLKYKSKYLSLNLNPNPAHDYDHDHEPHIDLYGGRSKKSHKSHKSHNPNNKFKCDPEKNKYRSICENSKDGSYKTKEECIESCESEYINVQLKKAHIQKESIQYYGFIKKIIDTENMGVYIKGGNVIGLAVLKLIYNKYHNDEIKFSRVFREYLKLELIKDWDFAAYTNGKEITDGYREKLDKIALEFNLVPRAKTFVLYQTKRPILIYDKALFEIAILCADDTEYTKMEMPMTTMKVKVTSDNLKYLFIMAKNFYSWKTKSIPIDLDIVKKVMSKMTILIHPHKKGFYDVTNKTMDKGDLNEQLIKFIKNFSFGDPLVTQFLITQVYDPYRLVYRLEDKNLKKTAQIQKFVSEHLRGVDQPKWLLNAKKVGKVVDKFVKVLGEKLVGVYKKSNSLNDVLEFLNGEKNFGRGQIQADWKDLGPNAKHKLKNIFYPLVKHIGIQEFDKILGTYNIVPNAKSSEMTNNEKMVKFLKFLVKEKFFDGVESFGGKTEINSSTVVQSRAKSTKTKLSRMGLISDTENGTDSVSEQDIEVNTNESSDTESSIGQSIIPAFVKGVQSPYFEQIRDGKKTIEGRLNKGDFGKMEIGQIVRWTNENKHDYVDTKIINIRHYKSFEEYLRTETLIKCLPDVNSIEEGVDIYHRFYSVEDENKYGVLAIELELV